MPLLTSIYAALERLGGRPRELYTFARADKMWRYSSAGSPITVAATGLTYVAAVITRSRIERGTDPGQIAVTVRVARTTPLVDALKEIRTFPMVLGIHRHQPDNVAAVPVLLAYGDVCGVKFTGGWAEIQIAGGERLFSQPFPSKVIERQCQWATYSGACGVDESAFSFATTILSIERSKILVTSVSGAADHYYDLGQLALAGNERVYVAKQIGNEFHIFGALPTGVGVGDAVTLIAGDDKTLATCRDKFNNVDRFLGFDLLPLDDPMQTGLV
jgi:hypothetical protein